MNCVYKFHAAAKCPKGGRDEYAITVTSDKMIEVETIIAAAETHGSKPTFQEELCAAIAKDLDLLKHGPAGSVHLEGVHQGVLTACVEEFG